MPPRVQGSECVPHLVQQSWLDRRPSHTIRRRWLISEPAFASSPAGGHHPGDDAHLCFLSPFSGSVILNGKPVGWIETRHHMRAILLAEPVLTTLLGPVHIAQCLFGMSQRLGQHLMHGLSPCIECARLSSWPGHIRNQIRIHRKRLQCHRSPPSPSEYVPILYHGFILVGSNDVYLRNLMCYNMLYGTNTKKKTFNTPHRQASRRENDHFDGLCI